MIKTIYEVIIDHICMVKEENHMYISTVSIKIKIQYSFLRKTLSKLGPEENIHNNMCKKTLLSIPQLKS
jgi:hypothetical protein